MPLHPLPPLNRGQRAQFTNATNYPVSGGRPHATGVMGLYVPYETRAAGGKMQPVSVADQARQIAQSIKERLQRGEMVELTYAANSDQTKAIHAAQDATPPRMVSSSAIGGSGQAPVMSEVLRLLELDPELNDALRSNFVVLPGTTVGSGGGSSTPQEVALDVEYMSESARKARYLARNPPGAAYDPERVTTFLWQNQNANNNNPTQISGVGGGVNKVWPSSPAGQAFNTAMLGLANGDNAVMLAQAQILQKMPAPAPATATVPPNSGPPISPETVAMYKHISEVRRQIAEECGSPPPSDVPQILNDNEWQPVINVIAAAAKDKHHFTDESLSDENSAERKYSDYKINVFLMRAETHEAPFRSADGSMSTVKTSVAECIANDEPTISLETRIRANADGTVSQELKTFGNVPNQQQLLQGVTHDLANLIGAQTMLHADPPQMTDEQFQQHVDHFKAKYPYTAESVDAFLAKPGITVESVEATVPGHKPTINFRVADGDFSQLSVVLMNGVSSAAENANINNLHVFNNITACTKLGAKPQLKAAATADATAAPEPPPRIGMRPGGSSR